MSDPSSPSPQAGHPVPLPSPPPSPLATAVPATAVPSVEAAPSEVPSPTAPTAVQAATVDTGIPGAEGYPWIPIGGDKTQVRVEAPVPALPQTLNPEGIAWDWRQDGLTQVAAAIRESPEGRSFGTVTRPNLQGYDLVSPA